RALLHERTSDGALGHRSPSSVAALDRIVETRGGARGLWRDPEVNDALLVSAMMADLYLQGGTGSSSELAMVGWGGDARLAIRPRDVCLPVKRLRAAIRQYDRLGLLTVAAFQLHRGWVHF